MRALDPWSLELDGTTLIEASAGTGKTYTLTTLYVRMLVERDLLPREILVVTYTEAAMAELRERVRDRIQETIAAGEEDEGDGDGVVSELRALGREARRRAERKGGADPLRRALQEFDEAAIFTIHGFCQRTLKENAFQSGMAFDAELVPAPDALDRTLTHDLWMRILEGETLPFLEWLRSGGGRRWQFEPEALQRALLSILGADEEMPVLPADPPDVAPGELDRLTELVEAGWRQWARSWQARRDVVREKLLGQNDLNGNKYRRGSIESVWLPWLEAWAEEISTSETSSVLRAVALPKWWGKLTPEGLEAGTKKKGVVLEDEFFESCAEVGEAVAALEAMRNRRALALRRRFVDLAREEARKRREERHLLYFDDLLCELRGALRPPRGDRLAEILRTRYRFALIDEFQDTDPVQYEIFRRVWHDPGEGAATGGGGLVLIGDPKQAIYSFRGADVFTYLAARRDAGDRVYGLQTNWRSNAGLVKAVNAFFQRTREPFALEAIGFDPVEARADAETCWAVPGRSGAGLRVLMAEREVVGAHLGQAIDEARACPLRFGRTDLMDAFARDVADLLDSGARVDGRPIAPSDIAVLGRRKSELQRARRALEDLGIPCVDRGDADVFESREAWELASVLRAFLRSGDPAVLRAALSTAAHGLNAHELADWRDESPALLALSERFAEYARLWSEAGFGRAFEAWRRGEGVTERLLRLEDGERRLTNWLHLAELLRRIESDRSCSRRGLLVWLEKAIATPELRSEVGSEAALLRLERDDQAVSLVTLHRSKGLEYEVVYLPSLWEETSVRGPGGESAGADGKQNPPVRFHDEKTGRRTLDLGGPDYAEHVERSRAEAFSEQLRLLYVGLTRARRQCVIFWGAIGSAHVATPLAWLLHAPEWEAKGKDRSTSAGALKEWTDEEWIAAWQGLADAAGEEAVSIETLRFRDRDRWRAQAIDRVALVFDPPRRVHPRSLGTTSFSALVRGASHATESLSGPLVTGRDRDANVSTAPDRADRGGGGEGDAPDLAGAMHGFPRGPEAGTLLHDVLERVEFSEYDEATVRAVAKAVIERSAFDPIHLDQVMHVVKSVARTPLRTEPAPLRLSDLPRESRLAEMEFTLAAVGRAEDRSLTPAALSRILESAPSDSPLRRYADRASRLGWRELRGYLRGFIDAVFFDGDRYFLVDYKSNDLGSRQVDYLPDRLLEPMIRHDYVLQYLIYAVALDRHLGRRLENYDYEKHFGGVYYLFLRGFAEEHPPGCGVFFDRPPRDLLRRVSALLGGSSGGNP